MLSDVEETLLKPVGIYRYPQLASSKYETVLHHLDNGIILFNSSGQVTFANTPITDILNVPCQSLIGIEIKDLLSPSRLDSEERIWTDFIYQEVVFCHSKQFEITDPCGRFWLVTATYGDELDGDLMLSFKEISDIKQIQRTVNHNDQLAMLGKSSAAIAHEIRNPLTAIRGFIQLLRPSLKQLDKDEYAQIILMEIDRTNGIIQDFLHSSKPSDPEKTVLRISTLLRQAVLFTESEALIKGCKVSLCLEQDDELMVFIDPKQFKQVLLNLIRNAMDAIQEVEGRQGHIHIESKISGTNVQIVIHDNGNGIEKTSLQRLADPFFTTKEKGTGLGLSESYRIVKNHGGSISVESDRGIGTTFMISLPLCN